MGGFNDAFSSLNLANVAAPKPAPVDPFASLGSRTAVSQSNNSNAFGGLSGGGFFDSKPAQPSHQSKLSNSSSGFGGFGAFSSPVAAAPAPAPKASSAMDDLFDFSAPATTIQPTSPPVAQPSAPVSSSVFNLSSPQIKPVAPAPAPAPAAAALGGAHLSGADVWGGNEWSSGPSTAAPVAQKSPSLPKPPTTNLGWEGGAFSSTPIIPGSNGGFNPAPKVAADEEFGGWTSSTGATTTPGATSKGGFGADDDLFNNVWQ
jgi:stromal membrane-associated protein